MTYIKICGITDGETAGICARLGVDYIGLVFAQSRRQVTPEQAMEITLSLLSIPQRPRLAGVFVNAPADKVNRIAKYCHLDLIQLSGEEDEGFCKRIDLPLIRVVHVDQTNILEEIQDRIAAANPGTIHLLDRRTAGVFGGTGEKFDWNILTDLGPAQKVMVAGGLTPENVEELILRFQPWGVDVSSGVESHGRKDPAKILAFIRAVRNADAKLKGVKHATR